jgi:hypothetical protein
MKQYDQDHVQGEANEARDRYDHGGVSICRSPMWSDVAVTLAVKAGGRQRPRPNEPGFGAASQEAAAAGKGVLDR